MTETVINKTKNEIFIFLLETGCCNRCALRFIGAVGANFDDPENDVKKFGGEDLNRNGDNEQTLKKLKLNPCIICLDLLQDGTLQSMVHNSDLENLKAYDCDTFVNFISYPTSVLIREHSMEVYMNEKFPSFFKDHNIIPINRAWSLSIQNRLSERLGKKFDKNSYLQIQFNTNYDLEKEESSIMYIVETKMKKSNGQNGSPSRNATGEVLKTIDNEIFRKHVSIPPAKSGKAVFLEQVIYKHDFIFIAGRYCKYSRRLFQTPWLSDDGLEVRNSVQEILFEAINNLFKCCSLVFSSSGREDFDVRMLGRGRPFFIKIYDPKNTKIPSEKFRLIEKLVEKSKLIKIRDLQFVPRDRISNIKEGEQFKQKTYRALCIVDKPENLMNYIEKINGTKSVTLQQKTPIRVYHRRSSDIRQREIYSLEARSITGVNNLFELDVVTQAGTYIKEFVHGDLGRTKPSLSEIIGGYVDILALDVLDIHLDFPPPLDQENSIQL